jgi:hypothetical protein
MALPPLTTPHVMLAVTATDLDLGSGPPPVCADTLSTTSPLARLRAAMRNASFTQMNAYFDAFLVFFSDEHLVSKLNI